MPPPTSLAEPQDPSNPLQGRPWSKVPCSAESAQDLTAPPLHPLHHQQEPGAAWGMPRAMEALGQPGLLPPPLPTPAAVSRLGLLAPAQNAHSWPGPCGAHMPEEPPLHGSPWF